MYREGLTVSKGSAQLATPQPASMRMMGASAVGEGTERQEKPSVEAAAVQCRSR